MVTTDAQNTTLVNMNHEYDPNGNRTKQTVQLGPTTTVTNFAYDHQDRLFKTTEGTAVTEYTYDDQGNRRHETVAANGTPVKDLTLHYDLDQRLVQVQDNVTPANTIAYAYDDNGNLAEKTIGSQTTTFVNSPRNQPLTVTLDTVKQEQYLYDELGMRSRKTNLQDNTATAYVHDGRRIL